jgi:hypothetical protein
LILSAIVRGLEKLHAKFNGALQMTLNRRAGDPARGAPRFIRDRQLRGAEFKAAYVADGSRLCENALEEAAGLAVSAAAVVTQHVEFLGEGPAPYAFIAAISGPAPRILIARFRL